MPTLERRPFGRTGHDSSCAIFGAAALGGMKPARAEGVFELLLEYGVNHIDTAASYGDSELRLAPFLARHRGDVFLATKTGDRSGEAARASLERSLERMQVQAVDLIQLHNLVDEEGWQQAMGAGGALEALVAARDEGLVRFLGVTGHGTYAPRMHLRSLERFPFDAVLAPYSYAMAADPDYAADFEQLDGVCRERGVALQTIKAVARRRWQDAAERRFSWYEPLRDRDAIRRQCQWVLARPGVFLNTTSDGTILQDVLAAAAELGSRPPDAEVAADLSRYEMEPLFVRDVSDAI